MVMTQNDIGNRIAGNGMSATQGDTHTDSLDKQNVMLVAVNCNKSKYVQSLNKTHEVANTTC